MHPQVELVKELVRYTFKEKAYSCVFLLCKNPKLYSLLCCEFAKIELKSPYPAGTNFYYPISKTNKLRKVKICEVFDMGGQYWYKFEYRQGKNEVCYQSKRLVDFESLAKLAHDQESNDWIEGNNISIENAKIHLGVSFPTVVSQFRDFDSVINVDLEGTILKESLGVNELDDLKRNVKFTSPSKIDVSIDKQLIWLNTIPPIVENNNIVLLSASNSKYSEFKIDIESLFISTTNIQVVKFNELVPKLAELVDVTSAINPLSVWSRA